MNKHYSGLTATQVEESRREHGTNILTPVAKTPLWLQFLEKFRDPLIIILLVAGVLSVCISCYEFFWLAEGWHVFFEPAGIFMAILLATGLSFIFEAKADKEFELLNRVSDDEPVQVIRDGRSKSIPKRDVVVGDIVVLSTGQEIPADGLLLEAVTLTVDESSLTGEPLCHKDVNDDFDEDSTYPSNHVLRGTKVMEGHGVMRTLRVGDKTENGKVMTEAQMDDGVKTPLNIQLDKLGKVISLMSYGVGVLIMVGRVAVWFATLEGAFVWSEFITYMLQSLMIAVTLVVCSVPEGLPMAVTLSLAYSMRRMLKTNNLVRKMHACETMGATTVICTDKTGTLTQNRMRVVALTPALSLKGEGDSSSPQTSESLNGKADNNSPSPFRERAGVRAEAMAVNSTAVLDGEGNPIGNPTEGALLLWLKEQGEDYQRLRDASPRLGELPFSTERKLMGTMVKSAATGRVLLHVKGAPEIIAALCGMEMPAELLEWQNKAMRTLAFASLTPNPSPVGEGAEWSAQDIEKLLKNADKVPFTWLGAVAISDPLREDVPGAVRECQDAGIEVKIVTGDTPATATEIARQIGILESSAAPTLNPSQAAPATLNNSSEANSPKSKVQSSAEGAKSPIITGPEFAALSDEELTERVADIRVIARARPTDKKRLVEALQRRGAVVAVTGDGTNDAPALNAAHVGLSMGDGTAVAREASDITIIDNSFVSISRAVMWGRSLYRNIQRFILFQMTVNVAACLVVMGGAFMDTQSPLTVTQMLWVNLIMDTFAAMALASLPPTQSVMADRPRRQKDFIIDRAMAFNILGIGLAFSAALLALLYRMQHVHSTDLFSLFTESAASHCHITLHEQSIMFTVFVMLQFWNMFNARAYATGRSAFHLKGCKGFNFIITLILAGQVLMVELGGEFFNVEPLSVAEWAAIILGTSPVVLLGELLRLLRSSR